jgi:peptide/nickel transport system permease protein
LLLALLALLVAAKTGWFPIGGMHSIHAESLSRIDRMLDLLHHLALPALVLAASEAAALMRYMRSNFIQTMSEDYIRTARAKGMSEATVAFRHALPNAMNPMITLLGISFGNMISASFLVEVIMGWPGIGRLAYDAMLSKDLHVVMASLLLGTLFLVIGNVIADILLARADRRISTQ